MFTVPTPCVVLVMFLEIVVLPCFMGDVTADRYRAAVLEHVRFGDLDTPVQEVLDKNLRSYEIAAELAGKNGVDIIVFPEFGIFPHTKHNRSVARGYAEDIPDPSRLGSPPNPCDRPDQFQDRFILTKLSCLAKNHHLYLVANMVDSKECDERDTCNAEESVDCKDTCPEDGLFLHNTNVVFDRSGNLITRYYKRHLYFEFDLNVPRDLQHAYFHTEFGTFTTCTCFDLSFYEAVDAVVSKGVLNVAYPTYWYDHQPFAVATQFQQSWAMKLGVNFLAANAHLPGTGTLGSGIYSGSKGHLIYTHNPDGHDKLLIADVPTQPGDLDIAANAKRYLINGEDIEEAGDEIPQFEEQCAHVAAGMPTDLKKDYRCALADVTGYNFIKLNSSSGAIDTCSNELCCSMEYEADSMNEEFYFGSYSGAFNFYNAFEFGNEVCLLARCDGSPCSVFPATSNTVFRRVKIQAKFLTAHVYPSVLHSGFQLATGNLWSYDVDRGLEYQNERGDSTLLAAGLHGRRYDLDRIF